MVAELILNPWLEQKLGEVELGPEILSLILEIDLPKKDQVKSALSKISNLTLGIEAFDYINVKAPIEAMPFIEEIEGVKRIHYDMPTVSLAQPQIPTFNSLFDPLLGKIKADPVLIPAVSLDMLLPVNPFKIALAVLSPNYKYVPVSVTKTALLDVPNHGLTGKGVKVAVLDTGVFNLHPQMRMKVKQVGTQMFPFPLDDNGHGQWCCSTVAGDSWASLFGVTDGIAPLVELLSVKVLGYGIGTGTAMTVLQGMEKAYQEGAKIISMSLGSEECQGGCADADGGPCPECRIIHKLTQEGIIFSIAAGNSGPDDMTLSCPACSPSSIAVAAWSYTDDKVSWFSSRGPQNKRNSTMNITDLTMKPDVASLGGGRANEDTIPDELLYNGCCSLLDGMTSGIKHGAEGLKGSSMSCPHISGLLALALEKGVIKNTADVKVILAAKGHAKDKESGWGFIKLSTLIS